MNPFHTKLDETKTLIQVATSLFPSIYEIDQESLEGAADKAVQAAWVIVQKSIAIVDPQP